MVMEHVGGGELFEYIIKHGKVSYTLHSVVILTDISHITNYGWVATCSKNTEDDGFGLAIVYMLLSPR